MNGKLLRGILLPFSVALSSCLSGCSKLDLLNPKGSVGVAEKELITTATLAMLIVVVPVIILTLAFAWRYRASNRNTVYAPKWAHSTAIEVVVWTIPTLIILFLGILTWKTTHELDPYKPLESSVAPINVEVVAPSRSAKKTPRVLPLLELPPIQNCEPLLLTALRTLSPMKAAVPSDVEVSTLPAASMRATRRGDEPDETDAVPGVAL